MLPSTKALLPRPSRPAPMSRPRHASSLRGELQEMKEAIRSAANTADAIPALRSRVIGSGIYRRTWEAVEEGSRALAGADLASSEAARSVAEAYATCYALRTVTDHAANYALRLNVRDAADNPSASLPSARTEQLFLEQIRPAHKERLFRDFGGTWKSNDELRQAAILSVLDPGLASKLGLRSSPAHQDHARGWAAIPASQQLSEAEFLALIDYVNSGSDTFNAVNGAAIAAAYYGDKLLSELMLPFTQTLHRAVDKLCAHPWFGKRDVVAYKGINLNNAAGPFRLAMLESAKQDGRMVAFPSVLSATTVEHRSYAVGKHLQGYQVECRIRLNKAFDADPFHDPLTMGEMEVIAPAGARFLVKPDGREEREHYDGEHRFLIKCFDLVPAPGQ